MVPVLERLGERRLVDQTAARGVDEDRGRLHLLELFRPDHVLGLGRERHVQGDDVALAQDGVEIDQAGLREDVEGQHLHAERLGALADRLAERAVADDAERRAGDVADRMGQEAELARLVPHPVPRVLDVGEQVAPEREDERDDMLRHGVEGVVADIDDGDAVRLAIGLVDDVGAGRRHRDQLELRQLP